MRLAAIVPNRAEFGDMIRNQLTECRRLGVDDRVRRRRVAGPRRRAATRPRDRRHRRRAGSGRGGCPRTRRTSPTSATCSTGAVDPSGDVVVIDEIGFHHATSVAELLADRGCTVEIVTHGMVVGQDLGITLDMENWWMRAGGEGHRAVDRSRADGHRRAARSTCCTTRPGPSVTRDAGLGRARRSRRTRSSGCTTTSRRPG